MNTCSNSGSVNLPLCFQFDQREPEVHPLVSCVPSNRPHPWAPAPRFQSSTWPLFVMKHVPNMETWIHRAPFALSMLSSSQLCLSPNNIISVFANAQKACCGDYSSCHTAFILATGARLLSQLMDRFSGCLFKGLSLLRMVPVPWETKVGEELVLGKLTLQLQTNPGVGFVAITAFSGGIVCFVSHSHSVGRG